MSNQNTIQKINNSTSLVWITRRRRTKGQTINAPAGAVVAIIDMATKSINVGWSLCNQTPRVEQYEVENTNVLVERIQTADRMDKSLAQHTAYGRAALLGDFTRTYTVKGKVTREMLYEDGIPQSAVPLICDLVSHLLSTHKGIETVRIYCKKPVVDRKPQLAWSVPNR
jgi:hypothetical protein